MKTQSYLMSGISVWGKLEWNRGKKRKNLSLYCVPNSSHTHTHTHTHTVSIHKPLRGWDLEPHFTSSAAKASRREVPCPLVKEHMGSSPGVRILSV